MLHIEFKVDLNSSFQVWKLSLALKKNIVPTIGYCHTYFLFWLIFPRNNFERFAR